jgi:hypothetical protein
MAFGTPASRGTANSIVNGAVLSMSPTQAIPVGSIALCTSGFDNITVADGATTDCVVTDSVGNTWELLDEYTNGAAGAGLGVGRSQWFTKVTTEIGTSDTITMTLTAAVDSRAMAVAEVTVGSGMTVEVAGEDNSNINITGTAPSTTIGALASQEYLFTVGYAGETSTSSGTFTNYTKVAGVTANSGVSDTSIRVELFTRVLTGTGDTAAGANFGTARDKTFWMAALKEVAAGGGGAPVTVDLVTPLEMPLDVPTGFSVVFEGTPPSITVDLVTPLEMSMDVPTGFSIYIPGPPGAWKPGRRGHSHRHGHNL